MLTARGSRTGGMSSPGPSLRTPTPRAEPAKKGDSLRTERSTSTTREMAAREAAREDGIEAVAITTPNAHHHAACVAFLERGIDVICDETR